MGVTVIWLLVVWLATAPLPDPKSAYTDTFATKAACEAEFVRLEVAYHRDTGNPVKHRCLRVEVGIAV